MSPSASTQGPVAAPRLGNSSCVESEELKAYVDRLQADRTGARAAALAASGAREEERRGTFLDPSPGVRLGDRYEAGGKRFAVAAEYSTAFQPVVPLAKRGNEVQRLEERPRAHAVRACGIERCLRSVASERHEVRSVVIELAAVERWGEPLLIAYDYWWARVSYAEREPCPQAR